MSVRVRQIYPTARTMAPRVRPSSCKAGAASHWHIIAAVTDDPSGIAARMTSCDGPTMDQSVDDSDVMAILSYGLWLDSDLEVS
jgi:hypothetical protein